MAYLKFGISDRFLSSKVEFRRLDCIGSCGARTKYQHIFLRIYMHKITLRKNIILQNICHSNRKGKKKNKTRRKLTGVHLAGFSLTDGISYIDL